MGKRKVLAVIALVIAMMTAASADEVISIDINNYGNTAAFTGQAAVPGAATWIAYDGGWGVPAGSPRSAGLTSYDNNLKTFPVKASTYAAQVWLADQGNHGYVTGAGSGLLDDGFVSATPSAAATAADPNISFIGLDMFGTAGTAHAYGGVFDVYIYGDSAGTFRLTDANDVDPNVIAQASVTGTVTPGVFELGKNYVVFENIAIADPFSVLLRYSNELNGIQLVRRTTPVSIQKTTTTVINAADYSAAYDMNNRAGEPTQYGPDTGYSAEIGSFVTYLAATEYMEYDIAVTPETMGQYNISAGVTTVDGPASMQIFIDGALVGAVSYALNADGLVHETSTRTINLFPGNHTIKWVTPQIRYNNIVDFRLNYVGPVVMTNCTQVYTYGFNYAGDLNGDCRVDIDDLVLFVENWANCYNPEPGACD
ncbi:MAG: hypothetical protein LLF76_03835 [Planctomycetaceae bacterium]|nr:hypothetical protein [Planctomycetaceae bacterium]